jgi:hypothetical protein
MGCKDCVKDVYILRKMFDEHLNSIHVERKIDKNSDVIH